MTDLGVRIDREALETLCSEFDLSRVLLHGSRATGHHRLESDIDIGVLQTKGVIPWRKLLDLQPHLSEIVQSGTIDLVDLRAVPGLLRHLASERGVVLYERTPGVFAHF
ncbi:MAG: nucleotidyltransferase domain-containing protein, partial [Anaerolineales bacterium]